MRTIFLFILSTIIMLAAQAQPKKTTATKPAQSNAVSAVGNINQSNYGKVVDYMNSIVDCMNNQGEEISRREIPMNEFEKFLNTGKKNYLYDFKIDLSSCRAITNGGDITPPSIMSAEDAAFFKGNYKALRDAFLKLVTSWNDLATYSDANSYINLTKEEAKPKYDAMIALEENYYTIRRTLATRNKQLQRKLFPFSVANSPNKEYYTWMYNDLNTIKDFAYTVPQNYEEMKAKKDELSLQIKEIEKDIIAHILQKPINEDRSSFNMYYGSFYDAIYGYMKNLKILLNSKDLTTGYIKRKMEDAKYNFSKITSEYNSAMTSN